jgi:amidase
MNELAKLDATALAELVRSGQVTPQELVEAAIGRIERLNPQVNAVITPLYERALAQAKAPRLPKGPFRGVPILLKDFFLQVAGTPYYEGMRYLRDLGWRSRHDTYLAARLRAAGFIFLGKTNLPELARAPITDSAAFGAARNPFDLRRTAGGSSGGSAAAVASGMVAAAHGNDGTGSLRVPASCCGLVGLKPSRGRISTGPRRSGGMFGSLSEFVLTRSVRDAAAILECLAGSMPGDLFQAPPPSTPYRSLLEAPLPALKVGLMTHDPLLEGLKAVQAGIPDVHAECVAAVEQTGLLLEGLGHYVERAYPPGLDGPTGLGPALGIISASGLAHTLDEWSARTHHKIGEADVEPATWARAQEGRSYSGVQVHAAYQRLVAGVCTLPEWWAHGFDLLVTPTMAQLPPELGETHAAGRKEQAGIFGLFTMPYNFTGQPAISLPLGWSAEGLPVGVQLVAGYGREDLLLQAAAQLEVARPWVGRYPLG